MGLVVSRFEEYSKYYDIFYSEKDYENEARYVDQLIRRYSSQAHTVLDLGCGTGRYDDIFSSMGYSLTGVDISETMLDVARKRNGNTCKFFHGDMRTVRLEQKYDVVVSLFHVMSYQIKDEDLILSMQTAKEHLAPAGLFIFDFWNGPGVQADPPEIREREFRDKSLLIRRKSTPSMFGDGHRVDVTFNVVIEYEGKHVVNNIEETHSMRYLFLPELTTMLKENGFSLMAAYEWMTFTPLDESKDWNGIIVAMKEPD